MNVLAFMVYLGGAWAFDDAGEGFWAVTFWPVCLTRRLVRRALSGDR